MSGAGTLLRWGGRLLLALLVAALAFLALGYWTATRDPVVRRLTLPVADWPADAPPLTILLVSDTHVAGPDMPPERLGRLAEQLNQLGADLVLIPGDLISEKRWATRHYGVDDVTRPLARFRAPLGTIVTLGNHDHWFRPAEITTALQRLGITVLRNQAVRRGPLVIGGVDDDFSRHDDVPGTVAAMDRLGAGPRIIVTHSPDIVPDLPQAVPAILAGHTHCGQIVLPFFGALASVSRYGDRYLCGVIRDPNGTVVVGAGLGTSIVPLRIGAVPDVWLVTLGPPPSGA